MFEGTVPSPFTNPFAIEETAAQDTRLRHYDIQFPFISPSPQLSTSTPTPPLVGSRPQSPSRTTSTRIRPNALPTPTYHPPDPTKKTHARKQPAGHVPRPRNAFILFRCDFVRQKKVPENVENNHRNISRIAGGVWREMSDEEKDPWVQMAETEKRVHGEVYPGYRYTPGAIPSVKAARRKVKEMNDMDASRVKAGVSEEMKGAEAAVIQAQDICSARRSSSCPPIQATSPGLGTPAVRPQNPYKAPLYPLSRPFPRRRLYPEWPYNTLNPEHPRRIVNDSDQGRTQDGSQTVATGFTRLIGETASTPVSAVAIGTVPDATINIPIPPSLLVPLTSPPTQPSNVYETQAQTQDQNQNIPIDALPLRRRSSSWPPRATPIFQATTQFTPHTGSSFTTPNYPGTALAPTNNCISNYSSATATTTTTTTTITTLDTNASFELHSPPPSISTHYRKTRRAFARDLDLDPPPHVPVLHGGPYAMAPPGDAPGWDCALKGPVPWGEWVVAAVAAAGGTQVDNWEGMDVDDCNGVFVIPNDMNFPAAAEVLNYEATAVSDAHASVVLESQVHPQVEARPLTPKLQPWSFSEERLHTKPVFTNPFAPGPRMPFSMGGREVGRTAATGVGVPPDPDVMDDPLSGAFTSDMPFGGEFQPGISSGAVSVDDRDLDAHDNEGGDDDDDDDYGYNDAEGEIESELEDMTADAGSGICFM